MKVKLFRLPVVATASFCLLAITAVTTISAAEDEGSPIFGVQIPPGYRNWPVITVAHEAGNNNDIRAVVGNDIAMKAFRDGVRPFPDGTIIARLAWEYVSSARNNEIFGQAQSFVAGAPTNVQFSIKDSQKYADTGGWGFGQFENGKANRSEALMKTCAPCHARLNKADDLVFTHYSP